MSIPPVFVEAAEGGFKLPDGWRSFVQLFPAEALTLRMGQHAQRLK